MCNRVLKLRTALLSSLLCAALVQSPGVGAQNAATTELSESQQAAYERLMEMANYLAGLDSFSVTLRAGYDAAQEDGQIIQFLETRELIIERPDHLRVEEKSTDGGGHLVIFDGSKLTVSDGIAGVYAQTDQPGHVDDTMMYFVRDLQMRLPLAAMLSTRFPEELNRRLREIEYVETSLALHEPTDHLAARTNAADFQVWIANGDRPLPLRVVLTYPDEGRPKYWADFSDWNLQPAIDDAAFTFEPADNAARIPFAIQIPTASENLPPDEVPVEGGNP